MVRKGLPRLYLKKKMAEFLRLRSVWNQNRNSAGRYGHKHNIFDMNFKKKSKPEPAIIWKRITSKKILHLDGSTPEPAIRSADTLFWQLSIDDNIDVQSAFSWASKVARKCESKHWYACGSDGRSVARSLGHVITKFSGMGRFIYSWCSAGALRARSSAINRSIDWFIHFLSLFYSGLLW